MRTHKTLTVGQKATKAAFASLPAALRPLGHGHRQKKDITEALRQMTKEDRGGMGIGAALDAVVNARDWLASTKHRSHLFRPFVFTAPDLAAELEKVRKKAVIKAAKKVVKFGATGGTEWNIEIGAEESGYTTDRGKDWNTYARSTKYPAIVDQHYIAVPRDWRLRVRPIGDGSGVVGDAMILDAVLDVGDEYGRAVYRVRVARAGRGYGVKVSDEFVSCWHGGKATLYARYERALNEAVPEGLVITPDDLDVLSEFAA